MNIVIIYNLFFIKFYRQKGQTMAMHGEQTTFNMRVDKNLVEQFKQAARDNNRTASQLLRDCMIEYVKKNRQGDMFKR